MKELLSRTVRKRLLSMKASKQAHILIESGDRDDDIDHMLARAWKEAIGLERYMVIRVSSSTSRIEMQVLQFNMLNIDPRRIVPCLIGPKLIKGGEIGRMDQRLPLAREAVIERRLLNGSWVRLGRYFPSHVGSPMVQRHEGSAP